MSTSKKAVARRHVAQLTAARSDSYSCPKTPGMERMPGKPRCFTAHLYLIFLDIVTGNLHAVVGHFMKALKRTGITETGKITTQCLSGTAQRHHKFEDGLIDLLYATIGNRTGRLASCLTWRDNRPLKNSRPLGDSSFDHHLAFKGGWNGLYPSKPIGYPGRAEKYQGIVTDHSPRGKARPAQITNQFKPLCSTNCSLWQKENHRVGCNFAPAPQ